MLLVTFFEKFYLWQHKQMLEKALVKPFFKEGDIQCEENSEVSDKHTHMKEKNEEINNLKAQLANQEEKFNTVKTFFQSGRKSLKNGKIILEFSEDAFNEFEQKNCPIQ